LPTTVLWFADCELRVGRRELRVADRPRKLEPKAFEVLTYLCVHRARVVDRREMIDAIWKPGKVLDAVLGTSVMKARRAIDDYDAGRPILRTWHRRGYRVVADVRMSVLDEEPGHDVRVQAPGSHCVAVLPFENQTGRPDLMWIEYGLSNRLSDLLAETSGISVLSPLDVLVLIAFIGRTADARTRARMVSDKLHAKCVVSARIRLAGSTFELEYSVFAGDRVLRAGTLHGDDVVKLTVQLASAIRHDVSHASL
jgi:DNA-binding winged helix-turn-helix (wHTH) protein